MLDSANSLIAHFEAEGYKVPVRKLGELADVYSGMRANPKTIFHYRDVAPEASHSWSGMHLSGARVTLPNAVCRRLQIARICFDFVGESPPGFSGFAIARALAAPRSSNRGKARRKAR